MLKGVNYDTEFIFFYNKLQIFYNITFTINLKY